MFWPAPHHRTRGSGAPAHEHTPQHLTFTLASTVRCARACACRFPYVVVALPRHCVWHWVCCRWSWACGTGSALTCMCGRPTMLCLTGLLPPSTTMSGESMVCRGTLEGHTGWVTAIATPQTDSDFIVSASRGAYNARCAVACCAPAVLVPPSARVASRPACFGHVSAALR